MTDAHGLLMDRVYHRQKHIYDATRKFYLFGRDRLIDGLELEPGMRVLELGCGTGRNLAAIGRRWPGVELYGVDISGEMLGVAAGRLGQDAQLCQGDACRFDAMAAFAVQRFDRVVISYALSMIPEWPLALAHAASLLGAGGQVHAVDFGDFAGLPGFAATLLLRWLARFHVAPRDTLGEVAASIARQRGLGFAADRGPFGYYRLIRLQRPGI